MKINDMIKNPKYIIVAVAILIVILIVVYMVTNNVSAATVANGDTVQVYYTGTLTNGTVFDSNVGKQLLTFTVGSGQVITGFDQGVIGMQLNQNKTVTIPANEAYGPVNPKLIVQVPISVFGNQSIKVGMVVTQTSNGQQFQGTVTEVNSTNATINFNSPLAGQTLIFKIQVVAITKKK